MNLLQFYEYLQHSRKDLQTFLLSLPDDVLSKKSGDNTRSLSIKDLIFLVAHSEDEWLNGEILQSRPIWTNSETLVNQFDQNSFVTAPISQLLQYWQAVETHTQDFLEQVFDLELERIIDNHGTLKGEYLLLSQWSVEHLLWNFMVHELHLTGQILALATASGFLPPRLDLLQYLPVKKHSMTSEEKNYG